MKKLSSLAKSSYAPILYEFLNQVKAKVADVRNPLKVAPELEKDVRLALCETIDTLIIDEIKSEGIETERPEDDYT